MREFSRIILHVQSCDAAPLFIHYLSAVISHHEAHSAAACKREVVLRDLKPAGEIRVEVVLPVEVVLRVHCSLECQCGYDRFLHCLSVRCGERTGMPHADGADGGVRRLAERVVIAAAEHLRLCVHLRVDFQPDDCF
ncbi:MAG: hypothetical protein UY87_C0085G0006 [Candidatus Peribacteria bacterium GW2011_GWC2_54_8]|nr:MAG: hypothetical protein UY87_C0085G0006 [Candidatus Peribacteria bacterium GW2011_GWC2_54_8]